MKTLTERSLETGITTVRLNGELTRGTLTTVRSAIGKAAGECPTAVVVDLSALRRTSEIRLTVFAGVTYHAQRLWGVPVLLCAAEPTLRRDLLAFHGFVALYDDHGNASTAVRAYLPRWRWRHLRADPASAAAARALLAEACVQWQLPHLRDTARLVASELAANAIMHAETDFDVTAAATGSFLRIAVHDGSRTMSRTASTSASPGFGHGLHLVQATSAHWGVTKVPDGKIVWALLNAQQ